MRESATPAAAAAEDGAREAPPRESRLRLAITRRLTPGWLLGLDAAAGVVFGLVAAVEAVDVHRGQLPWWASMSIVLGIAVPPAVRRRRPVLAFAVVLVASIAAEVADAGPTLFLAAGFTLYPVALAWRRRRLPTAAIAVLSAVCVFGLPVAGPAYASHVDPAPVLAAGGALGGAWTIGRTVRARRAFAADQARRLADAAAADERLRIARELHDVVGHTMGVIAVKAAISGHVARDRPDEAIEALRVIEATSRDALTDLRRMLGVLRAEEEAELHPGRGVAQVPALVERARESGIRASLHVFGVDELPESVGRSVYRVVQEGLTNVAGHAPGARCAVSIEADDRRVRIEVVDDGPATSTHRREPGGYGLVGIRERAAIHGGTVTAGPRPEGGFRLTVELPLDRGPHPAPDPCSAPPPSPSARA